MAALTGDIVDSSRLPTEELQRLPAVLRDIARAARKIWGAELVPLDIDVFRGDGWQWLLTAPAPALRLALYVRAALRSSFPDHEVVSRVAIGLGPVATIPPGRVSQGLGPAFTVSGQSLETAGKHAGLTIARAEGLPAPPALEAAALGLIDALANGWTAAQARAVTGALAGRTHAEIAADWDPPIDRTAVVRHVERAAWTPILAAIKAWEDVITKSHSSAP